eukprot:11403312-Heterocapsa_arctica.AAC.1
MRHNVHAEDHSLADDVRFCLGEVASCAACRCQRDWHPAAPDAHSCRARNITCPGAAQSKLFDVHSGSAGDAPPLESYSRGSRELALSIAGGLAARQAAISALWGRIFAVHFAARAGRRQLWLD